MPVLTGAPEAPRCLVRELAYWQWVWMSVARGRMPGGLSKNRGHVRRGYPIGVAGRRARDPWLGRRPWRLPSVEWPERQQPLKRSAWRSICVA